jgi:hypothetical protein
MSGPFLGATLALPFSAEPQAGITVEVPHPRSDDFCEIHRYLIERLGPGAARPDGPKARLAWLEYVRLERAMAGGCRFAGEASAPRSVDAD